MGQTRHHGVESPRSTAWKSKYSDLATEHAPRSIDSTSTSHQADDASRSLTACMGSHSTTTVSIATFRWAAKSKEVGSREVLCRRDGHRLNRADREVSARASTKSNFVLGEVCREAVQLRRRRQASSVAWWYSVVRRGSRLNSPHV